MYNTVVLFEGEYKKTRKILCTVQGQSEHLKCTGPAKIIKTLPFFSPLCLSHQVLFIGMVCQVLGLGCCLRYFKRSLCFRKDVFLLTLPPPLHFTQTSKRASLMTIVHTNAVFLLAWNIFNSYIVGRAGTHACLILSLSIILVK